jgi:hypothetical protein
MIIVRDKQDYKNQYNYRTNITKLNEILYIAIKQYILNSRINLVQMDPGGKSKRSTNL